MGSERGGKSATIAYSLIETAKLNGVDPLAWQIDVLSRIADHKSIVLMSCYLGITLRSVRNVISSGRREVVHRTLTPVFVFVLLQTCHLTYQHVYVTGKHGTSTAASRRSKIQSEMGSVK